MTDRLIVSGTVLDSLSLSVVVEFTRDGKNNTVSTGEGNEIPTGCSA